MPFIEIIDRALYQSDANPDVTLRLEELGLRRGLVIDLCGVDPPSVTPSPDYVQVRAPIADGPIIDPALLRSLAQLGARSIEGGIPVVSMCEMGRNRSGLMAALIVMRLRTISGAEAIRMVRERNPEAIANQWFEEFLRRDDSLGG